MGLGTPLLAQVENDPFAEGGQTLLVLIGLGILLIIGFVIAIVLFNYGKLWLQAFVSNARVSMMSLVGMSLRQVHARTIVEAKIMAMQAGVGTDPHTGITTRRLEASRFEHPHLGRLVHRDLEALLRAERKLVGLEHAFQ